MLSAEGAVFRLLNRATCGLSIGLDQSDVAGDECLDADGFRRRQRHVPAGPLVRGLTRGPGSKHRPGYRVTAAQESFELLAGNVPSETQRLGALANRLAALGSGRSIRPPCCNAPDSTFRH